MLAYMLLPLLGLGLFAAVLDGSDDDFASTATNTDTDDPGGTDGADELIGTGGADLLNGLEGGDILRGYGGDDTLLGGDGDDLAVGGDGDDALQGSIGDDTLWGRAGDDLLDGSFGDDTLRGDDGDDVLRGGEGDDALLGGEGDDALIGNQGNDLIETGNGEDTVFGGDGDDRITGFHLPVGDGFAPGEEDDGADRLNGGDGDDTITGNAGDLVSGGAGEDLIRSFGFDQEDGGGVTVTDFDPAEDNLLLAVGSGSALDLDAEDADLEITQAENGTDTNVVVNGILVAVLQDTDAATLAADTSWLVNLTEAPGEETAADAEALSPTLTVETAEEVGTSDTNATLLAEDASDPAIGPEGDDLESDETDDVTPDVSEELVLSADVDEDETLGSAEDDTLIAEEDVTADEAADPSDIAEEEELEIVAGDDETTSLVAADDITDEDGTVFVGGSEGDLIMAGAGEDLIRVSGSDLGDQPAVTVTEFDPAEDMLVLTGSDGEDLIIENPENLLIRAAFNDVDTEVVYDGTVVAVLQGTDAAALASDQSWIGNTFAMPEAVLVPGEMNGIAA